ncbi:Acyl-[acyl-carrier-protein]--UDP-N-acetylglucosamine O-acyltransferase [bacterium HR19]|nr:Acyl-[acyl-carrier-protein]--UDP-N-acetylglucosamine O-acyltransferase [bacterium HR19]
MIDRKPKISTTSIISNEAEIGEETFIGEGVIIEGKVKIGKKNKIYHYAVIGTPPQHIAYKEEKTSVEIGDENIIREFVTIHRGTKEGGVTKIGSKNYIMAYAHIAHDCEIGDGCVLTSFSALAGHTKVGNGVVFGGYSGSHQFVRVGDMVMVGATTFLTQDVPPFLLVVGIEPRIAGINLVGLKRAGVPSDEIQKIKSALKIYLDLRLKIEEVRKEILKIDSRSPYLMKFAEFLDGESKRGFLRKFEKDELSIR